MTGGGIKPDVVFLAVVWAIGVFAGAIFILAWLMGQF